MKRPCSILGLIIRLVRDRRERLSEVEYLGYESYPSAHLSTVPAPAKSFQVEMPRRKAA
jgi:hypothetical protein